MRKKLFAILLSLCMVVTMMPAAVGTAWAEGDEQLYFIYGDNISDDTCQSNDYSDGTNEKPYELEEGECRDVAIGYITSEDEEGNPTFKLLDSGNLTVTKVGEESSEETPEYITFANQSGKIYRIKFTDDATVGETYKISYTDTEGSKTYAIYVTCGLPRIGAYKGNTASVANYLGTDGSYINYKNLDNKEFYIITRVPKDGGETGFKEGYAVTINHDGSENEGKIGEPVKVEDSDVYKVTIEDGFTGAANVLFKSSKEADEWPLRLTIENQVIGLYKDANGNEAISGSTVSGLDEFYLIADYTASDASEYNFFDNGDSRAIVGETEINDDGHPYAKVTLSGSIDSANFRFALFRKDSDSGNYNNEICAINVTISKAYEPADKTLLVCTSSDNGQTFTPIEVQVEDDNGMESPAQYVLPNRDSDGAFYILYQKQDGDAELPTLYKLNNYQEIVTNDQGEAQVASEFTVAKLMDETEQKTVQMYDNTYNVWKVTVPKETETATRVGFSFQSNEEEGPILVNYTLDETPNEDSRYYAKFMWIAGTDYDAQYAEDVLTTSEDLNRIYPCESSFSGIDNLEWSDLYTEGNGYLLGIAKGEEYMTKMVNLSAENASENYFYILHPQGTTLKVESWREEAYQQNYSGMGGANYGGDLFKKLEDSVAMGASNSTDNDISEIYSVETVMDGSTAKTITVGSGGDSQTMIISKVSLKKFLGTQDVYSKFTINDSGNTYDNEFATVRLRASMNVSVEVEGDESVTDVNKIIKIIDNASYRQKVMGIAQDHEYMNFEKSSTDDNKYSAYFDYACSEIGEAGQARYATLAVDLADGYVVEKITDKGGNNLGYEVLRNYYYALQDADGNEVTDEEKMYEMGWNEPGCSIIGNYDEGNDKNITYMHVHHCIGANITPSMDDINHEYVGSSNDDVLLDYLDEHASDNYTVAPKSDDWCTTYTIFFNQSSDSENYTGNEIIFHIKKAEASTGIAAVNNGETDNGFSCTEDTNVTTADEDALAANLDALEAVDDSTYRVVQSYNMSTTKNSNEVSGLYNITIPVSDELEGVDLTNCKVVNFGDDNVPIEMETTYTTDENGEPNGIVFTTGHFSNYAIMVKEAKKSTYSGGGSGAGATDNVTNTAENKATETAATTTATVKAETKTDSTGAKTTTATVDSTTASKIVTKAVENKSEEVVVDTSSKAAVTETAAGAKTEVSIPAETISQISEKTEAEVIIKTDAAEVVLDEKTVETVAEQAGTTGDVKLVVETVAQDDSKLEVELKLVSSNGNISDFNGGNVNVTVKLGKTLAAKKLICVYIDDNGTYHKVSGQLNTDGTYTFTTTHFSSYAIMAEEDVDKIIAEQIANVEKMVGKLSLKARSSKTSKGNIKVKVITDADDIKALEDLGYTVKYKFYRSTKKAGGYKAKFETSGKTYTNTTGKKGTRYYYKARVMVYDAQGTLIAKSALKQCKYACRTK